MMVKLSKTAALFLLLLIAAGLDSCKKEPGQTVSGEFTIDNTLYGLGPYYAYGFSFELGTEIKTSEAPEPDITIHAITDVGGNISGAYIDTPSLVESFALAGEFDTAAEASSFYNSLLELGTYDWVQFANNVKNNQVWVYKTREDHYVKFRIKNLVLNDTENGPYAEITIVWRIQPDGSTTFPE